MAVKLAITNEKGGCGKTTTAVNVSAMLAERGFRTLLIDADPQSYATMYYDLPAAYPSLYDALDGWLLGVDMVPVAIKETRFKLLHVLGGDIRLKQVEMREGDFAHQIDFVSLFKSALKDLDDQYDMILIDCPPQGYNLMTAIHGYADYVLTPMIPDEFALHSLELKASEIIRVRTTNPRLRYLGGLIVMDEASATKTAYKEALLAQDAIPFFRTTVRKNIALARAINAHEPIHVYAKRSHGAEDYEAVTDELVRRITA